jgi:hypothetical protein
MCWASSSFNRWMFAGRSHVRVRCVKGASKILKNSAGSCSSKHQTVLAVPILSLRQGAYNFCEGNYSLLFSNDTSLQRQNFGIPTAAQLLVHRSENRFGAVLKASRRFEMFDFGISSARRGQQGLAPTSQGSQVDLKIVAFDNYPVTRHAEVGGTQDISSANIVLCAVPGTRHRCAFYFSFR